MLSFFPRGVLDEILNLIESVSEDFPSYSLLLDGASLEHEIAPRQLAVRDVNSYSWFMHFNVFSISMAFQMHSV